MADERVAPDKPPAQEGAATGPSAGPNAATSTTAGGGPPRRGSRRARPGGDALTAYRKRAARALAAIVSVITTLVVAVLAVHIVFVAFEANTGNDLVSTTAEWAANLAWQFEDVFKPADPKVEVAVNYGLAALVYLIAGRIVTGLIRRLA
ncbi:hypothetical protein [Spirillospora sp. NPDC029432]|uniref:hypothetical protein n=1 Tax=Spirillospora sp. NPDC029432 TaxID=3154599 RepID=UPI0034561498